MADWGTKVGYADKLPSSRGGSARIGTAPAGPGAFGTMPMRPITSALDHMAAPLIGVDGKPIDLGQSDWYLSDAKMTKQFVALQHQNLADMEKLNSKLRKEYDAAKLLNKRKMKELQNIGVELSQIERVLSGSDRTSGFAAEAEATVVNCESKMQGAQEQCQFALHTTEMFEFMATRLRDETKEMDIQIEKLGRDVKGLVSEYETSTLTMHQAQAQRTRAVALVHTLSRHLEVGRAQRKMKMEKVEITLAEQSARLRDYDEKEKKRMTLSLMPRGDLDEDGEDRLKQLFLVRKIYNNMLTRRLRDDQRRTDRLSNAYQRIRTATGLNDVDAIIQKYKTRDLTVATLNAQMKAARDRVDMLAAERRQLVWALDEAQTVGASALESRALYNSVEDYDRKMAEASRKVREARERLNRVSVTLEECRGCIAKMMDRVGLDSSSIAGVVAGTAGAANLEELSKAATTGRSEGILKDDGTEEAVGAAAVAERSATSSGGRRASLGGQATGAAAALHPQTPKTELGSHSAQPSASPSPSDADREGLAKSSPIKVVQPDQLEQALTALEQRVGHLLAHLAAVFEREEAAMVTSSKSKSKVRRGVSGAASTVGAGRNAAAPTLETTAPPVTESDAAAHRMSVAVLSDKASNRVFQRLMTMQPDTSDRNVRINARPTDAENGAAVLAANASMIRIERPPSPQAPPKDDIAAALHKSAADLSKLLHGAGAGAVVDRVSLKRLSAMVATTMNSTGRTKPPATRESDGAVGNFVSPRGTPGLR